MKKLALLTCLFLLTICQIKAQKLPPETKTKKDRKEISQTKAGKVFLEVNTGSFATGNTSLLFTSVRGSTVWSFGLDGGYFVINNLALKGGVGVLSSSGESLFRYKVGLKAYLFSHVPIAIDFTGVTASGENVSWIGLQGGYALFLGKNVSVEPALRYNLAITEIANNRFQGLVGFVLHF